MPDTDTGASWLERRQADVDDQDDAFADDWRNAYRAAFIRHAVNRNWSREDAETWPDNICDDALISAAPDHDYDPNATALADVIAIEQEHAP